MALTAKQKDTYGIKKIHNNPMLWHL